VITWQRKRFRDYWRRLSQSGRPGRPSIAKEVRELIRDMWQANPTWGSPRIVGELRKLGIEAAKSTVEKYQVRPHKLPSPAWKAFQNNHVEDLMACDFFTVPTITYKVLFVFVILTHERRRVIHFNVTEHPIAAWTAQQVVEALSWNAVPRYLLRDRDSIYGAVFQQRVRHMGIDIDRLQQEQQRLKTELVKFERTYQMTSEACQQKFEAGELGDAVEFFEWTSIYSIYQRNEHILRLLEEKLA
jgi:hypothetical protein